MPVPSRVPGVADGQVAHALQPRWTRARGYLLTALAVCPVGFALCCAGLLVVAGAGGGFAWWLVLPLLGAGLPAVIVLTQVRGMLHDPPLWGKAAFLTGGCQLLLGGIPAVGMAMATGATVAAVGASAMFVIMLALLVLGLFCGVRAQRVLLWPLVPELGATPFTVALRARLAGAGMLSGSARLGTDRVEWSARRHKGRGGPTAYGSLPFGELRGARVTLLPDTGRIPWLRLSDGSVVHTTPGPAVLLASAAGEWLLPLQDADLFLVLLNRRVAMWRLLVSHRQSS